MGDNQGRKNHFSLCAPDSHGVPNWSHDREEDQSWELVKMPGKVHAKVTFLETSCGGQVEGGQKLLHSQEPGERSGGKTGGRPFQNEQKTTEPIQNLPPEGQETTS